MDIPVFKKLLRQQVITETEFENIQQQQLKPVSAYWDVSTLLYLGILLFTTGIGILVYKNIHSISHEIIVVLIALMCVGCFTWCFRKAKGYAKEKVESPGILFDYVLLPGCLLLLIFVGYLQFEYNTFGNHWGMATFIPMVILYAAAYYFDHLGVLSLAITNLAAWAGITITPLQILRNNDFSNERIIYAGLVLGAGLVCISFASIFTNIKAHFAFTYKNFGVHILFISLLAAMFHYHHVYLLWFIALAAAVLFFFTNALKERSYYFLVITVLYAYAGISYVMVDLLIKMDENTGIGMIYPGFIYFIASGISLIRVLIYYNKALNRNAGI